MWIGIFRKVNGDIELHMVLLKIGRIVGIIILCGTGWPDNLRMGLNEI